MLRKHRHLSRLESYWSLLAAASAAVRQAAAKAGASGETALMLGSSQELEDIEELQTLGHPRDHLGPHERVLEREAPLKRLAEPLGIDVRQVVECVAECAECKQFQSEKAVGSSRLPIDVPRQHDL